MSLTIVLSGPKSSAPQARTALASRGFVVTDNIYTYGLHDSEAHDPEEFVHVLGDDINAAANAVTPLGYRLRIHYETPEEAQGSAEQQMVNMLADYERRIATLEARLANGR